MEIELTILGGLRVTVEYGYWSGDASVGLGPGVDSWRITAINGKYCKTPPEWVYRRIRETTGEEDRIIEACQEDHDFQ